MQRLVIGLLGVVAVASLSHAQVANKCLTGKIGCVGTKAKALLSCHAKATKKGVDPATDPKILKCLQKARAKFETCFAKLEAKSKDPCITTGDVAAREAKVDAFVFEVVDVLNGP